MAARTTAGHGGWGQPREAARLSSEQRDLSGLGSPDYGPLGVELKNNVKRQWWKAVVQGRDDVVGLDSCVILAREVWETSGHVQAFVDPLVECTSCHKRFRADHLEEGSGKSLKETACPSCGNRDVWTEPKMFNGLLSTKLGVVQDDDSGLAYLRPETAQGIFINYANVQQSARKKPPSASARSARASARDHPRKLSSARQSAEERSLVSGRDRGATGWIDGASPGTRPGIDTPSCGCSSTPRRS